MKKILVIDEDKLILWSVKKILTHENYEVQTVESFGEALNQMKDAIYDLIYMGLKLDEVSDIDMIKKINGLQPKANIIVLTALARDQIEDRLKGLNIFSIVEKPFNSDEIKSCAQKALVGVH